MSKQSVRFIIILMSCALLGVLAMQYYFIKESFLFKAQLFDRTINEALKNVSLKLEKQEAAIFLSQKAIQKAKKPQTLILIKQKKKFKT